MKKKKKNNEKKEKTGITRKNKTRIKKSVAMETLVAVMFLSFQQESFMPIVAKWNSIIRIKRKI